MFAGPGLGFKVVSFMVKGSGLEKHQQHHAGCGFEVLFVHLCLSGQGSGVWVPPTFENVYNACFT